MFDSSDFLVIKKSFENQNDNSADNKSKDNEINWFSAISKVGIARPWNSLMLFIMLLINGIIPFKIYVWCTGSQWA